MSKDITIETPETPAFPMHWTAPPVDVFEGEDRFVFMVDVPGAKAETLELEVEGRRLHLRAPVSEGRGWRRAFEVGELVDVDAIEAKVEQGVLSLTLPKREAPAPRRIPVQA